MIDINNLCFSYTGKKPYILNDVTFNIPKGSYVSIVGDNGSCKTTLMKLILGLLKPTLGSITINSSKKGYVPQRLDSFNSEFPITVFETLFCHSKLCNKNITDINSALQAVNMASFKDNLLGNLSGGQQQKILIARALLSNPEVIFLDEPSTGIDANSQKDLYNIISNLNKKSKITILSIEHNIKVALDYSTHILKLNSGKATLYTVDEFKKENNNYDLNKAI